MKLGKGGSAMARVSSSRSAHDSLLLRFRVSTLCVPLCFALLISLIAVDAAAQVDPNDVIKLGTELLRLGNDQQEPGGNQQEAVPPTYVPQTQPSKQQPAQAPTYSKAEV